MSDSLRDIKNSQTTIGLVHEDLNRRILGTTNVIRLTTTSLAKNALVLRSVNAKAVIYKEAVEVLEAYMLSTFIPSI